MKIGLNLLHVMPEIGGGWNYIRDLVRSLLNADSDNHYIAFVTDSSESILLNGIDNLTVVKIKLNSRKRIIRIFFENTILQYLIIKYRVDCMHWFCNYRSIVNVVPSVVTVYDLQPFKKFNKDPFCKRIMLRYLVKNSVKKAEVLLPMSNATKDDLTETLYVSDNKMMVIPPVLNPAFSSLVITDKKIAEFRIKYKLPDVYWVYVAHYYPHKNHIALLQAYCHLINCGDFSPWPLVLRGDGLTESAEILHAIDSLKLGDFVTFVPRVAEDELSLLYAAAGAMVFPSLYEGGGIPVLEAMACGCPVLSSRLPSIVEYAGDAVFYCDAKDVNNLYTAMMALQKNYSLRNDLVQKGIIQARMYIAEAVVSKLLFAYKSISSRST